MRRKLSQRNWLFVLLSAFFALVVLTYGASLQASSTHFAISPLSVPTCAPTPCPGNNCDQERIRGYQPERQTMYVDFNDAARNDLGSDGPTYNQIYRGIPPVLESVSASRSIPHIIMRGIAWQESSWLQFGNAKDGPDKICACTLMSYVGCGYGLMQITSCMSDADNGCGWFDRDRVAGELRYNLGTGTRWLITKWNAMDYIGNNDHTSPEQWYYAVTAYGPDGWDFPSDPNRAAYDPARPPFGEGNYLDFDYPYQEVIWGWMAHPENAYPGAHNNPPSPPPTGWNWLWRHTYVAPVPRGIFGLGSGWEPPTNTPKPVFHLLYDINVGNSTGPSIVLRNTTGGTLAADIVLYNQDGTFNRRWLEASSPYIRVNAGTSRTLPVKDVFPGETFVGYARISASEGIEVKLQPPSYAHKIFLPIVVKNYGNSCYEVIDNGGFEEFLDGKPLHWVVSSDDQYSLADGTWFRSGHYGAHLGGYDDDSSNSPDDSLWQEVEFPSNVQAAHLSYQWYMQTEEYTTGTYDHLYIRLRRADNGALVATLADITDNHTEGVWQTANIDLLPYASQYSSLRLSFEANTDYTQPTSFFVDNVSLQVCTQ